MAQFHQIVVQVNLSPNVSANTKVNVVTSPSALIQSGFNLPVSISTPSAPNTAGQTAQIKSVTVMAHFDTGASRTNIDKKLAAYLGLIPVGVTPAITAAGAIQTLDYVVDIDFPGTELSPFINLPIGSCDLPFRFQQDGSIIISPNNFGLLLGRDIMSRWNIVWNGPTSTVLLSD